MLVMVSKERRAGHIADLLKIKAEVDRSLLAAKMAGCRVDQN